MSIQEAKDAIAELQPSKPVFILQLTRDWDGKDSLTSQLAAKAVQTTNPNNAFSLMAIMFCEETWDSGSKRFRIDERQVLEKMNKQVVDGIRLFLKEFSDVKNYSESRQGKWYDRYALQNGRYLDNFYSLAKYMYVNKIDRGTDPENVHVKNIKGILQIIFERDYKDEHLQNGRKRRRRR